MIYKYRDNQPIVWFHKKLDKSNRYCLYCGSDLLDTNIISNKEHLIGREFVPSGSFDNGKAFNFIFRSCQKCNDKKGKYDRHISSITLVSSPACSGDTRAKESATRKANKDFHPTKRGVLIKDASENFKAQAELCAGADVSFGLVAPPQMNISYANALAIHHVQGLFSLLTSNDPSKQSETRILPPQNCKVFGIYKESDWGNSQLLELVNRSKVLSCYANINTAEGYFKAIMKRDDVGDTGWFWALEWNKSYRVVGYISHEGAIPEFFKDLPELNWHDVGPNARMRQETSLNSDDDHLFDQNVVESVR